MITEQTLQISFGYPNPLGTSLDKDGVNFSIYSSIARSLSLFIFIDPDQPQKLRIPLDPVQNRTADTWHIKIKGLPELFEYGFFIDQSIQKYYQSHSSTTNLFLNDPYAKLYTGGSHWGKVNRKSPEDSIRRSLYFNHLFDWEDDRPPQIPLKETIIYELHVRGYTQHPSSNVINPGTFAGLSEKIPHLRSLGITTVELLPINDFDENRIDRRNPRSGAKLYNFWGYDPLGYFSIKSSYAAGNKEANPIVEFKQMVKDFHKAGIEVILDIVFNHTGEGPLDGPTFSFRGLDNATYYIADPVNGKYHNYTGCGNTVNCNHPAVRRMIIDALRYWVLEMHIDGFRFDLASILCRDQKGDPLTNPPIIQEINNDPVLSGIKLIAEAWDAGGLYLVGSFPGGSRWAEWNDKFRDTIRKYIRGDAGMVPDLATRIAGSADLFRHNNRSPFHSINFITSHDGFTLADLVTFKTKHNLMNGENDRDGLNENYSANYGTEGKSIDRAINRIRLKQMKNLAALLMLSQGVPMILAGDELGRSQEGNNNAYCQDNKISWLNWQLADQNKGFLRFFQNLIHFRKKHSLLRRQTFFEDDPSGEIHITWYDSHLNPPNWRGNIFSLAFHLLSSEHGSDLFIMSNAGKKKLRHSLPELNGGQKWYRVMDTDLEAPEDFIDNGTEILLGDQNKYSIVDRSTVLLIAK